jgi:hypothetical protein
MILASVFLLQQPGHDWSIRADNNEEVLGVKAVLLVLVDDLDVR